MKARYLDGFQIENCVERNFSGLDAEVTETFKNLASCVGLDRFSLPAPQGCLWSENRDSVHVPGLNNLVIPHKPEILARGFRSNDTVPSLNMDNLRAMIYEK